MATDHKVTAVVKTEHLDPVEALREAVALLAVENMKPSHISIHAPWRESDPWKAHVTGERPFKEAEVSAVNSPADPPAGAAPSASDQEGLST